MSFPKELEKRYSLVTEIGADIRGFLFRVIEKSSKKRYLLRVMPSPPVIDIDALNQELIDLAELRHENLSFMRRIEALPDNCIAIFMDDCEGTWIRYHMKQLRESADVFHRSVIQLCKGMEYIHHHGLCHWDIRPETVFVNRRSDDDFQLVIIDVGLSFYLDLKQLEDHRDPRYLEQARYMSPEIIMGRGCDCRSDLYSLGIVLFETATGVNPFDASSTAGVVSAQLNKNAPQAKEINRNVSDETNALILRLLAKESAFRPASASEVALEIASDVFNPSIPPRTGGVFTAHPLPRREIQTAFENSCVGKGSVVTLYGATGVGKSELLRDIEAEFTLSGIKPITFDCRYKISGGATMLRKLMTQLSEVHSGLNPSMIDSLYYLASEDGYLHLSNRKHIDNLIRKCALQVLSKLFLSNDEDLDTPTIFILKNCHFKDYIFWQFFHTLSTLLSDHPQNRCPALWIIETNDSDALTVRLPSVRQHQLVELMPFDQDETNAMLSSLLGLTPFPEDVTQWVYDLSSGLPRRICLISDVMRNTRMVSWTDGDWHFSYDVFQNVSDFKDIDHLLSWLFNEQLSSQHKQSLISIALWFQGGTEVDIRLTLDKAQMKQLRIHELIAAGWIVRQLRDGIGTYYFRYSGLRTWLHQSTPAYQRNEAHMLIAEALETREGTHPAIIASHFFMAENRLHGCEYATKAARIFRSQGNFELAAKWFQLINDHMPDRNKSKIAQVSYELAQSLIATATFESALSALDMAEPIMESRFHQKREKANYLMLYGVCQLELQRYEEAAATLRDALEFLPKTTALDYRLKIVNYLSRVLKQLDQFNEVTHIFSKHQKQLPLDDLPYFAGQLMETVSWAHLEKRDFHAAEFALKESIRFGELLGDPLALIDRYLALGRIYERGYKFRQAIEEYERVITLARRGATRRGLANGLCHLASLNLIQHKTDRVAGYLSEAKELANRVNDPNLIAWSSILESSLLIEKGQLVEAETLLVTIEGLIDPTLDPSLANRVYLNRSEIARRNGNYFKVLEHYQNLLKLVEQQNQKHFIAFTYLYMTQAHIDLKHVTQAVELLENARNILDEIGMILPDCAILEAQIYILQNQYQKARKTALMGLTEAREKNLLHQQAQGHKIIGQIEMAENHAENAIVEFRAAMDFFRAGQEDFEAAVVHRLLAHAYGALGKLEMEKTEHENADRDFKKLSAFAFLRGKGGKDPLQSLQSDDVSGHKLDLEGITELIGNLNQPEKVPDVLISCIIQMMDMDHGAIILRQNDTDRLTPRASLGLSNDQLNQILRKCLLMQSENKPTVSQITWDTERSNDLKSNTAAWIIPIMERSQIMGLLYIDSAADKPGPTGQQLESLARFCSRVLTVSNTLSTKQHPSVGRTDKLVSQSQIIAKSQSMDKIRAIIDTVVHSLQPALIWGSDGTGKSFIAGHIHSSGRFKYLPISTIQCQTIMHTRKQGVLTDTVFQSIELTSQNQSIAGGTILLEEVDLLSQQQQGELVQLLSSESDTEYPMIRNRRIIVTATESLRKLVQAGKYNETLYRLLSRLSLKMPTLAERKEDISDLVMVFLKSARKTTGKQINGFSPQAIDALRQYPWPKNVSELRDAVESAALFCSSTTVQINDLPREIRNHFERSGALEADKPALRSLDEVEEAHIRAILAGTRGNKLRTCEILGISRPTLDRKLEKYGIKVEKKRKR